jgi:hypothetical protein
MASTKMPWGVREMHVRHPAGHVFRLSELLKSLSSADYPARDCPRY